MNDAVYIKLNNTEINNILDDKTFRRKATIQIEYQDYLAVKYVPRKEDSRVPKKYCK